MKKIFVLFIFSLFIYFSDLHVEAAMYFPEYNTPTPYSAEYGGFGVYETERETYGVDGFQTGGYIFYKMPYKISAPIDNQRNIYYLEQGNSIRVSYSYSTSTMNTLQYNINSTLHMMFGYEYGIEIDGYSDKLYFNEELTIEESYIYNTQTTINYEHNIEFNYTASQTGYYIYQTRAICNVYIVQHYHTYGDRFLPSYEADGYYVMITTSGITNTGMYKCSSLGEYQGPIEPGIIYL